MRAKMICSDNENRSTAEESCSHNNSHTSNELPWVPPVRLVTVKQDNIQLFKVL